MQKREVKSLLAFLELITATAFWGFGFIAAAWALKQWSAMEISVLRFFFAIIPAIGYFAFTKIPLAEIKNEFRLSLIPGFLLALTIALQTQGLKFTTPAKSAFITTTYVVIVPLLSHFLKDKIAWSHWVWVAVALMGSFLVSGASEAAGLQMGDLPTFLCAVGAAVHIYWLGHIASQSKNTITFGIGQSFWALLFSIGFLFLESVLDPNFKLKLFSAASSQAWLGIFSLAFGSTVIGFTLQVKAQKQISASLASILFLLEAPMAFGFSYLFLGEVMSAIQLSGAILIVVSCLGSVALGSR